MNNNMKNWSQPYEFFECKTDAEFYKGAIIALVYALNMTLLITSFA